MPVPDPISQTLAHRRMVVLVHGLDLGGAERQALLFASQLRARHASEVEIWSLNPGEWGQKHAEQMGIPTRVLSVGIPTSATQVLHMAGGLLRRLRVLHVDLLVPFLDLPNLLANLAWRLSPARACLWNQRNQSPRVFHRGLEALAFRLTGAVVGNSHAVLDSLRTRFGPIRKRTFVVYNGVRIGAPRSSRSEWRRRLRIGATAFMCCMTANLTWRKDHETVILAWRQVVDAAASPDRSDAPVLVVAGRHDDTASSIVRLAEELGIAESVRFPGFVDDVGGLLGAADLGVLSSPSEGCPNAVLEYMAAGLPVVATDLPSIREIVSEDNQRYLVPARSPESFAVAITTFLRGRGLREAVGRVNQEVAGSRYQPERMCDEMVGALRAAWRR